MITSAGRRKCGHILTAMRVCTGDFGTRARHLPRKRIYPGHQHLANANPSTSYTSQRAVGHIGPPLRRISQINTVYKEPTSQRAAWWDVEHKCRETKVWAHRSCDESVYRRLRRECEAPTTQAHLHRVKRTNQTSSAGRSGGHLAPTQRLF